MNELLRVGIVLFCFFAAIACYAFGVPAVGISMVFLGIAFEGLFGSEFLGERRSHLKG